MSVVNSQIVLPHKDYLIARKELPNPFPEPLYRVEGLEFREDLDPDDVKVTEPEPDDGSMAEPIDYPNYDEDMDEMDQEEADNWLQGQIPMATLHRRGPSASPREESTDTEAA